MLSQIAPGMRVLIRDEEWLVRRTDPSADDGQLLTCDGISDLVRSKTALFLTKLEERIEVLDPSDTELVADDSSMYNNSLLYLESQRRRSIPNDASIHLGHRAVMNLVPYQLDPALQALRQPRSRILIADATGLGKTLEAGILATELIARGRGKRILVIALKSMLTQFQKEWWSRFSIPLVRLDSQGLARVRNRIPANHNPFNHFDRSIISVDTLKNNLEYRNYLDNAWWDIIVIDECQNVAVRAVDKDISRRARLAQRLATRSDTLMLLSATPHDGSAKSFASLMSLLDPTAISDPDDYTPDDFMSKGLVIRRFKKDIKDQVAADFQERITLRLRGSASDAEDHALRTLLLIPFTQGGRHLSGRQHELQRVGMQKEFFSSPAAALKSTNLRIESVTRKGNLTTDELAELSGLREFAEALGKIDHASLGKYQRMLAHLRDSGTQWTGTDASDRLVVFSERLETLQWLRERLAVDLGLGPSHVAVLDGSMSDTEQQELVERFGRSDDPIKILLCSDVASEGLNLHYFCHRLIHFDLPWSLMVFQQRNGRIDRYGQKHKPEIIYLLTQTLVKDVQGDYRILEILQAKDEQANINLGDPGSFLNVYDPGKEVAKVRDFMADRIAPEVVDLALTADRPARDDNEGDWLLKLFGGSSGANISSVNSLDEISETVSLFGDDYEFVKTALSQLSNPAPIAQWHYNDELKAITITAPFDLEQRLRQLPREVQARDDEYTLCADPRRLEEAIESARQAKAEDDTWPQLHYLWQQHPIVDWLEDRLITVFGRHRAPVIRSPHLATNEYAFILAGSIPNRKGQPLVVDWQVVCRSPRGGHSLEGYASFVKRAGLQAGSLPNSGVGTALDDLRRLVPHAVKCMRDHMVTKQEVFAAQMTERLASTLDDLERLQGRQIEQLELRLENLVEGAKKSRFDRRSQQIYKVFDAYREWVKDTLTAEPQPFIQVLGVVTN